MENIIKYFKENLKDFPIYYCFLKISILFDSIYFIPTVSLSVNKNFILISVNFLILNIEFTHNNNDITFKYHNFYTPIIVFRISYFSQYKYEFRINWYNIYIRKQFCKINNNSEKE